MRIGKKQELRPSILDRLMDDEPHIQIEQDKNRTQYLRELRNSVKRDLESLLNTRYRMQSPPEELKEIECSILNYGLPDLATVNIADIEKKRAFTKNLEKTLRTFEPRFKSVKVIHIDNKDTTDRTLRFRIDATLHADPAPEVIIFDSVLDPVFRTVKVEESKHG
ncbi:MAG: type secretion protein [Cellvibrio sp.]|jgi:type VI secretion system protein ImpF|nr:type secretion protein [Cellvibrio sp.]MDF3013550.1 type secretion protein [Cellvibrio sp.]